MIIEDNGLGFENYKQTKGLGLKLIKQFCKKLPNSKYEFSFENGTKFELEFKPLPKGKKPMNVYLEYLKNVG